MIRTVESTFSAPTVWPVEVTRPILKASPNGTNPGNAGAFPSGSTVTVTASETAPGVRRSSALPKPARTCAPVSGSPGALAAGAIGVDEATSASEMPVWLDPVTVITCGTLAAATRLPDARVRSAFATMVHSPSDSRRANDPGLLPVVLVVVRTSPLVDVAVIVAPPTRSVLVRSTVPEMTVLAFTNDTVSGVSLSVTPVGTGSITHAGSPARRPLLVVSVVSAKLAFAPLAVSVTPPSATKALNRPRLFVSAVTDMEPPLTLLMSRRILTPESGIEDPLISTMAVPWMTRFASRRSMPGSAGVTVPVAATTTSV